MADRPSETQNTRTKKTERKDKLASALRNNLKRRKAAPRPKKPQSPTGNG